MDPVTATAQPSETPATIPVGETQSLATYREARDKGATDIPNPQAPASEAPVTPDPEVEADPELRKAIDEIEQPVAQETPQQKAARTKRHKQAAIQRRVTNLARARDEQKTRADNAERELNDLRQRGTAPAPGAPRTAIPPQPGPKAGEYDGSHASDPEPTDAQFATAPDPWLAKERAHADWRARKELRKVEYGRQQRALAGEADTRRATALRAFDTHAESLRKTEPGFDAAIEHLNLTPSMQAVIFGSGELGPHLALALAKDSAAYQRIVALPPQGQLVELGALKASVAAARKPAAAPPITAAPEPHTPVGGAGSASTANPKDIHDLATYRKNRDQLLSAGR